MSPIELLIEDNKLKNNNTKKESSSISVQFNAIDNIYDSSIVDNQNTTNNLLKMSSNHETSLIKESSESLPNDDRDAGGGPTPEPKKTCNYGEHENSSQNNHFYPNPQSSDETNYNQSLYEENVSTSSLSTTSSISPISDSQLSQSKNDELQQSIDKTAENLTESEMDDEIKSTLLTNNINSINKKPVLTSPPNTLALHTNLNNVLLSEESTLILDNPVSYYDQTYAVNHPQAAFLSAPTSSSSPSIQQQLICKSQPIEFCNNAYLPTIPLPAHNHQAVQSSFIYPSTQFSNHLNTTYLNNSYHPYSGYVPPQYLIQHVPTIQQQTQSNRAIVTSTDMASSSSSASTPTPKQSSQAPSSSSSSSSNATTSNDPNLMMPVNSSTIFVHIEAGHAFRVQLGEEIREILGPATVKMVSNDGSQPVPIQLTTPSPGQLVQQIIDENGVLTHLILSSQHQPLNVLNTNPSTFANIQPENDSNHNGLIKSVSGNSMPSSSSTSPSKTSTIQSNSNTTINSPTNAHSPYFPIVQSNPALAPTYYPYNIATQQTFQAIQSPHSSAAAPVLNQLTVLPNYQNINHHHQQQQQQYHYNQYIPTTNTYNNNLIPATSPSPSPQPVSSLQGNKQTSPVNLNSTSTSSNIEINPESNSAKINNNNNLSINKINSNNQPQVSNNLVSVSPSSSSSCSSTTSSVSSNSSVSNKSNDEPNLNSNSQTFSNQKNGRKNQNNDFSNNRHKEQKSFRKYNSNSFNNSVSNNLLDKFFNNSANVVSTALINTKPYHNFYSNNNNKSKDRNDLNDLNQSNKSTTTRTFIYTQQNNYTINKVNNKKQQYHQHLLAYNQANHHHNNQIHNSYSLHNLHSYNNQIINEHQKQYNQTAQFNKNHQNYHQVGCFTMENSKQMSEDYINGNKRQANVYENNNDFVDKPNKTVLTNSINETKSIKTEKLNPEMIKNIEFFKSILNRIKKPIVCDIEAQSVLVRLTPIDLDDPENSLALKEVINSSSSSLSSSSSSSSSSDNSSPCTLNSEYILSRFENVNYTLELSGDMTLFNEVYTGDANEITLKDLRPSTKYFLRVFASLDNNCRGDYTSSVQFQTEPCQPDQPLPPKQTGLKKKNEITLKWNSANDNGSKITNYILEFKDYIDTENQIYGETEKLNDYEKEEDDYPKFIQLYKGPLKQFIVKKLKPSTCYVFRLAAENSLGISDYSNNMLAYTSGCVPSVPESPILIDSTTNSLTLSWQSLSKNIDEIDFELQMINTEFAVSVAHGFLPVYNGPMLSYKITDLKLCCIYQFRLRAKNDEGYSAWSETVKYSTKADVPKPPIKLRYKIQLIPVLLIKVSWEEPKENCGSKIQTYCLELAEYQDNNFIVIYDGDQLEYLIDQDLKPGFTYKLRVSCSNSIGSSDYSEIITFVTPASLPYKCLPPKLYGKPKANSVQLRWTYPDNDGGSQIILYELFLIKNDEKIIENNQENDNIVWKGNDLNCTINNLLPGRNYQIKLRAINKIGFGPWSELSEFTSGSGVPDSPLLPVISIKSSNCLIINWNEPTNNGSPIIDYHLEWSPKENVTFTQLYSGPLLRYELKGGLLPATRYFFRVQATNINGSSNFSPSAECLTLASVPSIVNGIKLEEIKSDSIKISWKQPNSNGSPITFYNIDLNDNTSSSLSTNGSTFLSYIVVYNQEQSCEYKIESLLPDTVYKLRIQGANSIGVGHFSNMIKIKTKALPPLPPHLECISSSYNSIKLKWNHIINSESNFISNTNILNSSKLALNDYQIIYNLEMINECLNFQDSTFTCVYNGSSNFFKVNKLQESTTYLFRISASNETGQGKFSDIYKFTTTKSPPVILKSPIVLELNSNSCLFEWQPAKLNSNENSDSLEYCLQLQSIKKDSDYKEIYKGESCSFRYKNLESNMDYNVRVCAIRICNTETNSNRICSSFTSHTTFTTLRNNSNKLNNQNKKSSLDVSSSSFDSDVIKKDSITSLSKLSRFILPSFYLNLNTSKTSNTNLNQHGSFQTNQNSQKMQANNINNNIINTSNPIKKSSHLTKNRTTSDPNVTNNSCLSESISNRNITDQQWAFLFIIILVIIAFLIAYAANSIFTSYYDLSSEL